MIFLVDYNLDGYAVVFLGILAKLGWLELIPIQFVTFKEAGLSMDSNDRLDEFSYREQCVDRLIEIVLDMENYMGVGRLFIP
jgi:hypothetical protein